MRSYWWWIMVLMQRCLSHLILLVAEADSKMKGLTRIEGPFQSITWLFNCDGSCWLQNKCNTLFQKDCDNLSVYPTEETSPTLLWILLLPLQLYLRHGSFYLTWPAGDRAKRQIWRIHLPKLGTENFTVGSISAGWNIGWWGCPPHHLRWIHLR